MPEISLDFVNDVMVPSHMSKSEFDNLYYKKRLNMNDVWEAVSKKVFKLTGTILDATQKKSQKQSLKRLLDPKRANDSIALHSGSPLTKRYKPVDLDQSIDSFLSTNLFDLDVDTSAGSSGCVTLSTNLTDLDVDRSVGTSGSVNLSSSKQKGGYNYILPYGTQPNIPFLVTLFL